MIVSLSIDEKSMAKIKDYMDQREKNGVKISLSRAIVILAELGLQEIERQKKEVTGELKSANL